MLPVKVLRTGTNLAGNVTVFFRTVAGTAVDGVNYTGVATPLTFGSGQTSRTRQRADPARLRGRAEPAHARGRAQRAGQRRHAGRAVHGPGHHHGGRPGRPDQVRLGEILRAGGRQQRHAHGGAHGRHRRWGVGGLRHPRRHRGQRRGGDDFAPRTGTISVRQRQAPRPPSRFPSARTRWPRASRASPSSYAIHGVAPRSPSRRRPDEWPRSPSWTTRPSCSSAVGSWATRRRSCAPARWAAGSR